MATVYVGNAVCDENGHARGGEPGDQTGRELRIQPWYLNAKGWRVFRAKSEEAAKRIAWDCRAACENMAIGYNQTTRNTLYNASKHFGFNCSEVTELCECDCSSLVRVCILYAGIKINDFNTTSEPTRLLNTGEFEEMEGEKYTNSPDYLREGDVLVTRTKGHTLVILNDGPKAHEDDPQPEPEPEPTPEPPVVSYRVVVVGRSVNVRSSDSTAGRVLFVAHRGNQFPLIDIADSGWYHIKTYKGDGYISNREDLTCLMTV
ncbi:MAG: SH3 domain-containing protein [Bacteroidales bacterium]|nr:SH3 domain-containing protein [Bacteroidales bacterium]